MIQFDMYFLSTSKKMLFSALTWFGKAFVKLVFYISSFTVISLIIFRFIVMNTNFPSIFYFHINRSMGIMHQNTYDASYEEVVGAYERKAGLKYEFEGLENVPKEGRVILFSNHVGAEEEQFICNEVNKKVRNGTKYFTYLSNGVARALGVVMSEPDRERMIPGGREIVAKHIRDGNIMLIFPVGKIENKPYWVDFFQGYEKYRDRFKRGFIYLALENKCDLVPVYVDFKQPLLMCLINMFAPKLYEKLSLYTAPIWMRNKTVHVYFGKPVKYEVLKSLVDRVGYVSAARILRQEIYNIGIAVSEPRIAKL